MSGKHGKKRYWVKHSRDVVAHKNGLVVMVGASGSGKTTAAKAIFGDTAVVSSDDIRTLVAGDDPRGSNNETFDMMRQIIRGRLLRRLLTVVDATNVKEEDRREWVNLADEMCAPVYAVVVDAPPKVCTERSVAKGIPAWVSRKQHQQMMDSYFRMINGKDFAAVSVISGTSPAPSLRLHDNRTDMRGKTGNFDLIGDVHGCYAQLKELLGALGYNDDLAHPDGRMAVFLGDFVDRGPDPGPVLDLVMGAVESGAALAVPGNHDMNLLVALNGSDRRPGKDTTETIEALSVRGKDYLRAVARFISKLPGHIVLDGGSLIACHAGLPKFYHLADHKRARYLAAYGPWQGARDQYGYKLPDGWQSDYDGDGLVVYGHTVYSDPAMCGRTVGIDTGCVFGGRLTALRYPEMKYVSVPGVGLFDLGRPPRKRVEEVTSRPWTPQGRSVSVRHGSPVSITDDQASAAFEARFSRVIDPRHMFYVPGTMTPCEAAPEGSPYLERPQEAVKYYADAGITALVAQEKHMGSRAVFVLGPGCAKKFGVSGSIMTRYGRKFFSDDALTRAVIDRFEDALSKGGFWDAIGADWAVMDCELLPWSAKAPGLLAKQYVATSLAGGAATDTALAGLVAASARTGGELDGLADKMRLRRDNVAGFTNAYSRYCWPTEGTDGLQIAPFCMIAAGDSDMFEVPYKTQEKLLEPVVRASGGFVKATESFYFDPNDESAVTELCARWEAATNAGSEGVVIKPDRFLVRGEHGNPILPGIKVRGREYLRIIYGPDYTDYLEELRGRQTRKKARQAIKQFLLGMEGVARMLDGEPVERYNEPALAVIALNSEEIDPRL